MNEPGLGNAEHIAHSMAYVIFAGCSLTLVPVRLEPPTSLYAPVQKEGRVRKDPACVLSIYFELRT